MLSQWRQVSPRPYFQALLPFLGFFLEAGPSLALGWRGEAKTCLEEHHWNPKLQVFQALPPFSNVPHDQVRFGPILPWGLCEGMLGRFPVNATRITRKMKARGRAITWQAGHIALWFMRGPLMDAIFSASADRDPGPFFGLGASMVVFGVEVGRCTR
ncbi:unnamed protein product [Durusdinium trenchii]|uniref:Uncharacterized protein n=1 Tax=Durusdinium trenchii TaxID=1381693 RepID=A0ABP0SEC2_9DINO